MSAEQLKVQSRVFIKGKSRPLHTASDLEDITGQLGAGLRVLDLTLPSGEPMVLAMTEFVSATGVVEDPIEVPPSTLTGKGVYIRGLNQEQARELNIDLSVRNQEDLVLVEAEDLARVEIVVYDMAADEPVWTNPACDTRQVALLVTAAKLCAEAEYRNALAWEGLSEHQPETGPKMTNAGQRLAERRVAEAEATALKHLENGEIDAAVEAAGREFVDRVVAEGERYLKGEQPTG